MKNFVNQGQFKPPRLKSPAETMRDNAKHSAAQIKAFSAAASKPFKPPKPVKFK